MVTGFIVLVGLMLAAAAAAIVVPLSRLARSPSIARESRQLARLERALADGVLNASEFAAKRAELLMAPAVSDDARADAPAGSPPGVRAIGIGLVAAITVGSLVLYAIVGTPEALFQPSVAVGPDAAVPLATNPAANTGASAPTMDQAIGGLRARLAATPEDGEGWLLLARAELAVGEPAAARDAAQRAIALGQDDADSKVLLVEARTLAAPDRYFDDASVGELAGVLQAEPGHARALWLRGIALLQRDDRPAALADWRALLAQLDAADERSTALAAQIERVEQGLDPFPSTRADTEVSTSPDIAELPAAPAGTAISVAISIAPALAARLSGQETLFVIARAPGGPPMPLAVRRMAAADLPAQVVLTSADAMRPGATLADVAELEVLARISASGQAMPASGDFEGHAAAPVAAGGNTQILIDTERP